MIVFSTEKTHFLLFFICCFVKLLKFNYGLIIIKNNDPMLDEIIFKNLNISKSLKSNTNVNNKSKSPSFNNRDLNSRINSILENLTDEPSFVETTTPSILNSNQIYLIPTTLSSVSSANSNNHLKSTKHNHFYLVNLFVNILKSILQIGILK
jgi:hypothetical protein